MKFDNTYNIIQPTFVLANRSGRKIGAIRLRDLHISDNLNSCFELTAAVDKYVDGVECPVWNKIKDFKLIYCPEWDVWFEIYVEIEEDNEVVKNISGKSLGEAELSQVNLYGVEINTDVDISRDDYTPTIIFNESNPSASLLNRILEKAPHYTIAHVDSTIARLQRTFTFDGKTIYDVFQEISEEIHCLFVINSGTNANNQIAREISVYDLESYCNNCHHRGDFYAVCPECGSKNIRHGYGEDTTIFVSTNNLADGITYSTDTDSVKNCFKLEAGDDLMTATVVNCNPNGSSYLWYISDEVRSDMSDALKTRLAQYDALYERYQNTENIVLNQTVVTRYNQLINKYKTYRNTLQTIGTITGYPALMSVYYDTVDFQLFLHDELMPIMSVPQTTAATEAAKIVAAEISPVAVRNISTVSVSSASNAVLDMVKTLIDNRYDVIVLTSSLSGTVWTGTFKVTNKTDEDDTANSRSITVSVNDNYERYVKQKLDKSLSSSSDGKTSLQNLFVMSQSAFANELKKYCSASLSAFSEACQSCLDILIEQGIANNETWADETPNLYNSIYVPYRDKLQTIQTELSLRDQEIEIITGVYNQNNVLVTEGIQTQIMQKNREIQDALNFSEYLGTTLWHEFSSYRREDTYKNDNYISDGLDNAELFSRAREFIEVASKEIFRSATLQHSITSNMKNLLAMQEFSPLVDYFSVGNWIRIKTDGEVYRLRLLSYEIDFSDLTNISVEFSDVQKTVDGASDMESILNSASSMATSYGYVTRQASQGSQSQQRLDNWVSDGLDLTKLRIIDNAINQNVTMDNHGLLCREYLPITDDYDLKQLKIINRGLYLTDDNWRTARAGIGDFQYYDPSDKQIKEAYGVIAETLVGNLILSEKVGVYNMDNSITLDQRGLTIITNNQNPQIGKTAFTIRRKYTDENGVDSIQTVFYVDDNGSLHMVGNLDAASGNFTGAVTATSLTIRGSSGDTQIDSYISGVMSGALSDLQDDVDGKTTTYYGSTAPAHPLERDIWYDTANGRIKRYTNGQWVDITTDALKAALDAAGDAQATADGKIQTFSQNDPPANNAANNLGIGDLWIDTNDQNKLYRWDGTQWRLVRDEGIEAAAGQALSAQQLAEGIRNGTTGIFFQTSSVGTVSLNTTDGLKIVGTNSSYFQAKNNAMGFFKSDGTGMLYYEDGNMILKGGIYSSTGTIGGWNIGSTSIYSGTGTNRVQLSSLTSSDYSIWAGNEVASNAPFSVKKNGTIYSTSGTIGGWTIGSNSLHSGSSTTYVGMATNGDYALWAGHATAASAPFRVKHDGTFVSSSGTIGGWSIGSTSIYSGEGTSRVQLSTLSSNDYAIWAGNNVSANAPFSVKKDGTVKATSGSIGGWTLGTQRFYSGSDTVVNGQITSSTYVAIDANPSDTYAIWAGRENSANAPFRVKRDGTVYLTSLHTVTETGGDTTVNLNNYPFWKLNYSTIKSTTENSITLSNGTTINFKTASDVNSSFAQGWVTGYNAAATVSGRTDDTVTVPTRTATMYDTPTRDYTANYTASRDSYTASDFYMSGLGQPHYTPSSHSYTPSSFSWS